MDMLENARKSLLEKARRDTQVPEAEMKQSIRNNIDGYRMFKKNAAHDPTFRLLARNTAAHIYGLCSELRRRRTGKHTYEPTSLIYRHREVIHIVKLSDIVPHVVEP